MIYHNLKTMFIEITKNASVSVKKTLSGQDSIVPSHETYDMLMSISNFNGEDISDYYKFTISRNPYDRFCSGFEYMQVAMRWPQSFDETLDYLIACDARANGEPISVLDSNGDPIAEKSERALDGQLQYWWDDAPILVWPQVGFIKSEGLNGAIAITNYFKLEEIDQHWPTITAAIAAKSGVSLPNELPVTNSLPDRPDWKTYFEGELGQTRMSKIQQLYADDFATFGYSTEITF